MSIPEVLLSNVSGDVSALDRQLQSLRNRFDHTRGTVGEERQEALKKASQEFEAIFVNYMLKVMRDTIEPADEQSESLGKDVYISMFDQEIALGVAGLNSLGLGQMLYRQLKSKDGDLSAKGESLGRVPTTTLRQKRDLEPDSFTHSGGAILESGRNSIAVNVGSDNVELGSTSSSSDDQMDRGSNWHFPAVGKISSNFGWRTDPLTQAPRLHKGVDIAAPAGTAIRAARKGTVVFSGFLDGYGNTVILEHSDGYRSLYGHSSKNLVRPGIEVEADQVIGEVGRTGRSTGTHLHFELQKSGKAIDPRGLLADMEYSSK